jgi:hypothetical protein
LHIAIGNLTLRAWEAASEFFPGDKWARTSSPSGSQNLHQQARKIPSFISKLRAQRVNRPSASPRPQSPFQSQTPSSRATHPLTPIQATNQFPSTPASQSQPQQIIQYPLGFDPAYSMDPIDLVPSDWAEWEKLLANSNVFDYTAEITNTDDTFQSAGYSRVL